MLRKYFEQKGQEVKINYLSSSPLCEILPHVPILDSCTVIEKKKGGLFGLWQMRKELSRIETDILINLQSGWKSSFIFGDLKTGQKFKFKKSEDRDFPAWKDFARTYFDRDTINSFNMNAFLPLIRIPKEFVESYCERFEVMKSEKKKIIIAPSVGNSRRHRAWPVEHWSTLIKMLGSKYEIILVGSGIDEFVSNSVLAQISTKQIPVINLTGQLNLIDTAALMHRADLVIGCDTGPSHLSGALGRNTLILFGPTSELRHEPFHGKALRAKFECSLGCGEKLCVEDEKCNCMAHITPTDVYNEIVRELEGISMDEQREQREQRES